MFTNFTARRLLARALLAATVAALTLPAAAAPAPAATDDVVRRVSTAGLNLTQAADRAILRHRIVVAALKVCKEVTDGDSLEQPGFRDCFQRSAAGALAQMDVQVAAARTRAMVASGTPK